MQGAVVEGLAESEQVGGGELGEDLERVERVASRDKRERVESLVAHFGRLDVASHGVGQEAQFRRQGRDQDVGAFEKEGGAGLVDDEVRRQAVVRGRVDQLAALHAEHPA